MNAFLSACSRRSRLILLLIFALWSSMQESKASHLMGADLTYTCLGGNQYEINLTIYRDCKGIALALPSYPIEISSASCGIDTSIIVTQVSQTDISPLCPLLAASGPCASANPAGSPFVGVEQYNYTATFVFPQNCSDWVLSWEECCRNGAITNSPIIPIAGGTETYIESTMDNLTVSCNSSPTFTNAPVPFICVGEPFLYNNGALDPNGDSLVYELIDPLEIDLGTGNPVPVPYNAPFSANYPLTTAPANQFGFDPLTGQMDFTPNAVEQSIVAIRVNQYRNGRLIGSVTRDLQIVVLNACANNAPDIAAPINIGGGTLNGNTFTVCAGNTLTFDIVSTDADAGSNLTVSDNLLFSIPAAGIVNTGNNPTTSSFTWNTTLADVGIHSFTLTVADDACPYNGRQTVGFEIFVQDQVSIVASQTAICPGPATTVQLSAVVPGSPGNGTYTWTPAANLSDPTIASPVANLNTGETYTVNYAEGVCASSASITIENYGDLEATPSDPVLCNGGNVQINTTFNFNIPPPPGACGPATNTCAGPSATVQLGNGTSSTGTTANGGGAGSPFLGNYQDGRTQVLYPAAELLAAGVSPGIITEIAIDVSTKFSTQAYNAFNISMGCTGNDELSGFLGGLTQVFTGNVATVAGPNVFTLITPYEWDGVSNLVFEFCFDNATASGFDHVNYTNTAYNSVIFGFDNGGTAGCNIATGFISTQRPNISIASCEIFVPINYVWTPGLGLNDASIPNPIASPTTSTQYIVSVNTPACNFTDTVNVTIDNAPTINPFADLTVCSEDSVQITTSGTNLANATFTWTPAAGLSDPTAQNPIASPTGPTLYTLTAVNGCGSETATININVNPKPDVTLAPTNLLCTGDNSGSIAATVTGGTPTYTYTWNPSVGVGATVSNLVAGAYTLIVTDGNLCADTATASLSEPPAVTLTLAGTTDPTCNGDADGTIDVLAGGGTPGYTYTLSGSSSAGNPVSITQANPNFTGVPAGTYVATVEDINGCTFNIGVGLNDPLPVSAQILSQNDSDCLTNTGAFAVSGEGGTSPYEFSIDGANFNLTGSFTNLGPGLYTLTIRDVNGCIGTLDVPIGAIGAPTGTLATQVDVSCPGGNDGSFLVTGAGGTPPLEFSIDGTNFFPSGSFNNLSAGTYNVEVRDANGCPSFVNVDLMEPDPLQLIPVQVLDASCPGLNDASFIVTGLGGTQPYEYSLNGQAFSTNGSFNNLAAGTYTVLIRDVNLCVTTDSVTLGEPPAIVGTVTSLTDVDCSGSNTGSFSIIGSGGVIPYEYSLDGLNYQNTGDFLNLFAATYNVFIRDANGCVSQTPVTINEPPALTGNIVNQVNVDCAGNTNGSINIEGQGGTPGYTYSIDGVTFGTNGIFSNLAAGPYTITVRDLIGCTVDVQFGITEPAPLALSSSSQTDLACNGDNSGAVDLQATGGTAPYQYALNAGPLGNNPNFTGLAAGNYVATVQDANNCTATFNFTLSEPAPLAISINTVTDVQCAGGADGSLDISASAGTAPYEYSVDGVNFFNSGSFTNLAANTYTITVRDANGCSNTASATINEPAAIQITASVTADVSCNGGNDGAVNALAIGGTGALTYTWNPGGSVGATYTNLTAGPYNVSVSDINGCTETATVNVQEPAPIQNTITITQGISCFGLADAAADITSTGGNGGFTYTWQSGTQVGTAVTDLPAGTHLVTITDALGCTNLDSVEIIPPSEIVTTVVGTDISCFGLTDGDVTAFPGGGTGTYTYVWNNSPALNTAMLTGLTAGFYEVIVTDGNNCMDTASITLIEPTQIVLTGTGQNETCTDANGEVSVTATGGAGGYTYLWNSTPTQTAATATNLAAGTYRVVVSDQNGCQDSTDVSIIDEAAPTINILQSQDISCNGLTDGSIEIEAVGGTGTYTYAWTPGGQTTPLITGLSAGSYTVTVDDGQCTTTETINLIEPGPITAQINNVVNPACFGQANGTANVIVNGGTAPYTYQWNTTPIQNSPIATGLADGTYIVTVTDNRGCTATDDVTLVEPALLEVVVTGTNVLCFGENTGQALASVTGGNVPYTYNWSNGASDSIAANLVAGNYSVDIVDSKGCTTAGDIVIAEPAEFVSTVVGTDVTCFGGSNGAAEVQATGETFPYSYRWSTGDTTAIITNLFSDRYTVTVTDGNGCSNSHEVFIFQGDQISIEKVNEIAAFCDLDNGQATVLASGGVGGFTYSWNTSPAQTGATVDGIFGTGLGGPYQVIATDANGCQDSLEVSISNIPPPTAAFNIGRDPADPILLSQANLLFINESQGAVAYQWDFGVLGALSNEENPTFEYDQTGVFTVVLTAFDQNFSCPDTASLTFEIVPDGKVWTPSAFSPNNDGKNDIFYVVGEGIVNIEVLIFDRWGRLITTLNSLADGWNGFDDQGNRVQEGVYVYAIKAELNTGKRFEKGGTITLVR
ncbi:MAG: gliding motility-associated C-terminal domain-containing protein [Bacteroidota bacterium]